MLCVPKGKKMNRLQTKQNKRRKAKNEQTKKEKRRAMMRTKTLNEIAQEAGPATTVELSGKIHGLNTPTKYETQIQTESKKWP